MRQEVLKTRFAGYQLNGSGQDKCLKPIENHNVKIETIQFGKAKRKKDKKSRVMFLQISHGIQVYLHSNKTQLPLISLYQISSSISETTIVTLHRLQTSSIVYFILKFLRMLHCLRRLTRLHTPSRIENEKNYLR